MPEERLQKILSRAGVSSRRAAEQLVLDGRVRVNGHVVRELGSRADPDRDRIEVDGRPIHREEHVYYLVHKPRGMVTTLHDPEGRPALSELLEGIGERVYPVGRLDFNTSGALLVTNDGDLAQALLHPSREVPKTYVVKLNVEAEDKLLEALRRGVTLDDGYKTKPARVTRIRDEDGHTWLEITITEGKNRQVHRMIEAVAARVMRLARQSFAGLDTEGLRPGQLRPLDPDEIAALRQTYMGISTPPVSSKRAPTKAADRSRRPGAAGHASADRKSRESAKPSDRRDRDAARSSDRPGARGASKATRQSARTDEEKRRTTFDKRESPRHKTRPT